MNEERLQLIHGTLEVHTEPYVFEALEDECQAVGTTESVCFEQLPAARYGVAGLVDSRDRALLQLDEVLRGYATVLEDGDQGSVRPVSI